MAIAVPLPAANAAGVTVRGSVVSGAGMTVLAVTPSGVANRARVGATGQFRLSLSASSARGTTLQLVRKSGQYYGPVVLRANGTRSFTALRGSSASLGAIRLRGGWAEVTKDLSDAVVDTARQVRARNGKPLGASRLGFVRSTALRSSWGPSFSAVSSGGDQDSDGLPNLVDADDDGDLLLDSVDASTAGNSASSAGLFSTLYVPMTDALNVNAGGVTQERIDALVAGENTFNLVFFFDEGRLRGRTVTSVDVDCFTLAYCRPGSGTGYFGGVSESGSDVPSNVPWVTYDPNGNGLPDLSPLPARSSWTASVQPRVGTGAIAPGDVYDVIFRTTTGDVRLPTTLAPYFVTTPTVTSWSSGGTTTTVDYTDPLSLMTAPGSGPSNPAYLPDGRLAVTLWRPQRQAIAGAETGDFRDIGRLHYGVTLDVTAANGSELGCGGSFSGLSTSLVDESDPTATDPVVNLFPLQDTADDATPSVDNTLSFTVDLAGCLSAAGVDPTGRTVTLQLTSVSESRPGGVDRAAQWFTVRLP